MLARSLARSRARTHTQNWNPAAEALGAEPSVLQPTSLILWLSYIHPVWVDDSRSPFVLCGVCLSPACSAASSGTTEAEDVDP